MGISGINHAASAPALLRFAFRVAIHAQGWLPAGWLAFTGRVSNPLDHCEKVSDHMTILLSCSPDATWGCRCRYVGTTTGVPEIADDLLHRKKLAASGH